MKTGRKWKASKAVEVAESRLRQKALVGDCGISIRRAGLGYVAKSQIWPGPGQRQAPATQVKGSNRPGRRASGQSSRTAAAGMD